MRMTTNAAVRSTAGILAAGFFASQAVADDDVIGLSAGLTGYTAILDGEIIDGQLVIVK